MAYYTALINAWNGATQPPTGVTGTALTGGMTTAQKLAAVNGWSVTGTIPTTINVSGSQIANCIDKTEFLALAAQKQSNILTLCNSPGLLLGGSSNTSHILVGLLLDAFSPVGATITNLTALATASIQPWWQANSYPRAFDLGDVSTAGLS